MIKAVFWDIDGTMVMSEPVHDSKMEHVALLHGIVMSPETKASFHGLGDRRAYEIMQGIGMPGTLEQFVDACQSYYEVQLHTIEVRDGFTEAFAYLEKNGIHQSAVSNGLEALVNLNLARVGVRDRLKAVVDLDYMVRSGLNPKPSGDAYLDALRQVNEAERLSILPSECLVVEDSPTGVAAGKAAGMKTIFWKLSPDRSLENTDYSAYTAEEIMAIIYDLVPERAAA